MANSGYSSREILDMQSDAVRRVNEMQRISREKTDALNQSANFYPQNFNNHIDPTPDFIQKPNEHYEPNQQATNDPIFEPEPEPNIDSDSISEVVSSSFTGILEKLNLDDEKIMLIVIIILLVNEGADIQLVLALGYILLTG